MKYKKTMILLVLAIFIFGVASVCASDVNDTIIANEDDSIVELSVESNDNNVNILEENDNDVLKSTNDQTLSTDEETGSLVDLNHEINDNDNTTITLTKNYKYVAGDDAFQFGMDINRTLTINGNGHTIDGSGTASIFKINADHVTITNLTFKNCKAYRALDENGRPTVNTVPRYEFNGGAIKWEGNYGTITQCTFTENYAVQSGGAIKWSGDYGTVKLCNFKNNTAEYFFSGAIDLMGSNATVTQSNFTGNKALNSQAGAINFNDYSNVSHCIFINNTASSNGGAISIDESNNASYCIFIGNKARWGGAINMYSDSIIAHSIFANNTAEFDGGALFINDPNVLVINSTFAGNSANRGGAIYGYDNDYTKAILSIFDSNINETFDYFTIAPAYLNVNDFTTSYNSGEKLLLNLTADNVNYDGYNITIKIYNQTDDLVRTFHALSGDEWIPDLPVGYYHASFDSEYAGFQQINRTITITAPEHTFWFLNYTINGNDNPVIELSHDFYFDPAYDAAFVNGIVINRTVTIKGNGNAIDAKRQARIFYVQSANAVLENLTLKNAHSNSEGGAVYFNGTGEVSNCNFAGNTATGDGGAVYFDETGTVTNCNFTDNSAYRGGAVYFWDFGNVTNCNFINNKATGTDSWGGAVCFYDEGSVSNCNFTGNTATKDGGAVYFKGKCEVTNCNFTGNKATGEIGHAGALVICEEGNVTNCNFTDNTASGDGGAVHIHNVGTVTNCNFTNNKATGTDSWGGAILMFSGTVTNCNFTGNTATKSGGAIRMSSGSVSNCNFTGNNATAGSAIYFSTSATKTVSNSRFLNNRANAEALEITKNDNNITINFTGRNNLLNAIYSSNDAEVTFTNVTYWGANGINNTGSSATTPSRSNKVAGQNITVGIVVNDKLVLDNVYVTDENGAIVLNIVAGDNYYITARHDTDSYYTKAEKTISNNTKFNVNVTSQTTTNRTVNITAKSNIPNDVVKGKLLFILPNGTEINATYGANGTWWTVHPFDKYDVYQINASYVGLDNVTVNNGTITIIRSNSTLTVDDMTFDYNSTGSTTVSFDNAIGIEAHVVGHSEANVTVNGKIITVSNLAAGNYTLNVTTIVEDDYNPVTKTAKITVNKINSTITINNIVVNYGTPTNITVTTEGATGITAKIDDKNLIIKGNTILIPILDVGNYTLTVTAIADENHNNITKNTTVTINKAKTQITAESITTTYNIDKNLVITLKDSNGNPITNTTLTVDLNGAKTYTTDTNGQVKISTKNLSPKVYTAKIIFKGNNNYNESSKDIQITVIKATPKITAKKKTYKAKKKTKKFKITLKDNTGKPIKNAKVRLIVKKIAKKSKKKSSNKKSKSDKKKNYAKTNSKGKATFKVLKNKKGKYNAKVKFYGDQYYSKATKTVKIVIK